MDNSKSIFKKLVDSITNFINPDPAEENVEVKDHTIPGKRRVMPGGFYSVDQSLRKRPKLYHDLFDLPASRLVIPQTENINTLNDSELEISKRSNAPMSTSVTSSLNPRFRKMRKLNERSLNSRTFNEGTLQNSSCSYLSSSSKQMLEKLKTYSTPIPYADGVKIPMRPNTNFNLNPHSRSNSKLQAERVIPMKVVSVSESSNNIKRQAQPKLKSYRFNDSFDFDDIENISKSNVKINTNKPNKMSKNVSKNTNENDLMFHNKNAKDVIQFDFCRPNILKYNYDSDTPKFELKPNSSLNMNKFPRIQSIKTGWRCETCFTENENSNKICVQCENVTKRNRQFSKSFNYF